MSEGIRRIMHKVLIANRGEIAVRIARACNDADLRSVAVYSDSDADALHVRVADEAYGLIGGTPADTYLNADKIIAVALRSGADAVHPGYGFLSENAEFAQSVVDAGLIWIGPSPASIRALGNKITAREIAVRAGAPMVRGSDGPVPNAAAALELAEEYGLPIVIKAAFGGGGRGLKVVREFDEIPEAFDSAVREAVQAFGRGECFVEQYLDRPRHVETQMLADIHGNVVVVGTRDCSLQRRHQKLVEEAPAPFLTDEQIQQLYRSAKAIVRESEYVGAGTVEFMVADDGKIAFLEVNTRLQVEHPVTEQTSGIDLVQEQFRIAAGEALSVTEDPRPTGHSFEFRINAEDVGRGFLPSPGTIAEFVVPMGPGIRVDSGVESGSVVPAEFDSLLAKLIVTGATRAQALRRARAALDDMRITGIATVLPFHRAVVRAPEFTSEERFGVHTRWIESGFVEVIPVDADYSSVSPNLARQTITVDIDGRGYAVGLPAELLRNWKSVSTGDAARATPEPDDGQPTAHGEIVAAPMSGTLVKWLVKAGDRVSPGDQVGVLEAMKMEIPVVAPFGGTVMALLANPGEYVQLGSQLAVVE
jgi:acetyl-CoA/propionyl-CoA carboxylase biotin carboxyl carrier protein